MIGDLFRRAVVPLLVLALGIAALVHGVRGDRVRVYVQQEIEVTLAPPPVRPPMPAAGGPGFPGFPGGTPFAAPPPQLQKVKQKIFVGKDEPEMAIVRDVTIGGLVLLDSGELQRTYSGQPPSLCPT